MQNELIKLIKLYDSFGRDKKSKKRILADFFNSVKVSGTPNDVMLLSVMVSLYFEVYKYENLKSLYKIKGKGENDIKIGIWESYFYSENPDILKIKLTNLSPEAKIILDYFTFGKIAKELGEDFLLNILPTYFNKGRMTIYFSEKLANAKRGLKNVDTEIDIGSDPVLPFYVFSIKGNKKSFNYIIIDNKNLISNEEDKTLLRLLKKTFKEKIFMFLYYKVTYKNRTKIVPLLFSYNNLNIQVFLKNKKILFNDVVLGDVLFKKLNRDLFIKPKVKEIKNLKDMKENIKRFLSPNICLSETSVFEVKLKTKKVYFKIVDFYVDNNQKPVGVIYKDKNDEVKKFKVKITEEMLDLGIDKFYVEGYKYIWGNQELESLPIRLSKGLVYRCKMCRSFNKTIKKGLCVNCYEQLKNIALYNIDNEFSIKAEELNIIHKVPFSVEVEKYRIYYKYPNLMFERDDNLLPKGYQFLLPLDFS